LVGIIRTKTELEEAIAKIADLRARAKNIGVSGGRQFNPGFHLTFDLDNMLLIAEAAAKSALIREESRGGHTREDFPTMSSTWRQVNNITTWNGSSIAVEQKHLPDLTKELFDLFDIHELEKYMTSDELSQSRGGSN